MSARCRKSDPDPLEADDQEPQVERKPRGRPKKKAEGKATSTPTRRRRKTDPEKAAAAAAEKETAEEIRYAEEALAEQESDEQETDTPSASANGAARDTDDDTDTEAGADGKDRRGSRGRRGGRGGNSRKQGLNFRDLKSKIIPELHLLAKEVGLEDYRKMAKDELVVAILERSSESEGLKLVTGYLEISSDGYGFLQESLLQNNTRQVIVSAGLIKQFRLRTGDMIMGKARRPRDNERYGTLIRVEAVNGIDPFQAAKRPRFDDLIPTFPEQRIKLETTQNELSARVIDLLAPIGRGQDRKSVV